MQLDVIIATYNRQQLLQRTLNSLLDAEVPTGLEVQITVVDNNSKDGTRQTVEGWVERFGGKLVYLFERRQGKSFALNTGFAATNGDLVGMVDDDEEVDRVWFRTIYEAFKIGGMDFIGGPCHPRWGAEAPQWLPLDYTGVIGWIDDGDKIRRYDEKFPGILAGGNAVLTRQILKEVGPYSTLLGRTAKGLLGGEDVDLYERLLRAGARGFYLPDLIIYHYIPPERLTRRYFRRWIFWQGVSSAILCKKYPLEGRYIGGIPRWMYGNAIRGIFREARTSIGKAKDPAQAFAGELAVWTLMGFFYGRHFYRSGR